MDDLSGLIQNLLQDPQTMAQVQNLASSLGLSDTVPSASPAPPADPMVSALMRAAPLLSAANQEDDATRLLAALRPLLSEVRQKKLDEAARILKLLRLLPILKESGVLQNIL